MEVIIRRRVWRKWRGGLILLWVCLLLTPITLAAEDSRQADAVTEGSMRLRTRNLNSSSSHIDFDSVFDKPVYEWSFDEWVAVCVLAVIFLVAFCCLCNLVRCVLGCLCSCFGCRPRRRYYDNRGYYYSNASAPLQNCTPRPPAYNPAYDSRSADYYRYQSTPTSNWGFCDCLAAICCLQCCSQNRCSLRDMICGVCCFELCCRSGKDVIGANGNASGYGSMVV